MADREGSWTQEQRVRTGLFDSAQQPQNPSKIVMGCGGQPALT
jgi:hypothetical protein